MHDLIEPDAVSLALRSFISAGADIPSILAEIDAEKAAEGAPANPFAGRIVTLAQLDQLPPLVPLIDGTLEQETLAFLSGKSGSAKSFIAVAWSCSIATGTPWEGRAVSQGRVLYIAAEGWQGLRNRVRAWEQHHGVTVDPDSLHVLPASLTIKDPEHLRLFCEHLRSVGYALVVIDTLARNSAGLDENSAKDMGVFTDAIDQIRRAAGGTSLTVHHHGKDSDKGSRGSSAIEANADTVYNTSKSGDTFKLSRSKSKEARIDDRLAFTLLDVGPSAVLIAESEADALSILPTLQNDVVSFVAKYPAASVREIQQATGKGRNAVDSALSSLRNSGWIRREQAEDNKTWQHYVTDVYTAAMLTP
ncbi:AAA family ATPase [Streptomyces sp. NPDC058441]|uniref:AAA family ATPase n=1 Tax=Streptomyces sp. NPDC058441 TaxID=3346502 RepID=UPI00366007B3